MGQKSKQVNRADSSRRVVTQVLPYAVGVFGLAFIASCVTASIMTPVQNSDAAQQVSLDFDDSGYYANVTASDVVNLNLIATAEGATAVASDNVVVKTNSSTGYKLYISSTSATANANRLNNNDDSSYYISPTSGSLATPAVLSDNSWGYTTTAVSGNTSTIDGSSNFIGMPLLNSENLLNSHASASESGHTTVVYYGVKANTALKSGYYTSNVVYTVVAEGSPATEGTVNMSTYEATSLTPSSRVTISTGLYTSALQVGDVSVTIGSAECGNKNVTKSSSGEVKIECDIPSQTALGDYDVTVSIPKFGKTYTREAGFHYYIPWEDMTTMQEMTAYACSKVPTPSATVSDATRTYSYGNSITETQIKDTPTSTGYWNATVAGNAQMTNVQGVTSADGAGGTVAEKTLTDSRDGNTYRIRKLADGNCWMTQNLKLTWTAGSTVTTQNGTWTPTNSTISGDGSTSVGEQWGWNDTSHDSEMPSGLDDNGKKNWRASYSDRSLKAGTRTVADLDGDSQAIGVWYNWYAATAGTGTYSKSSGEATDSICPKGWQLPTNSGSKSWYHLLYEVYGGSDLNTGDRRVSTIAAANATYKDYHTYAMTNAMRRSPLSLPFTGYVNYTNGSIYYVGSGGYWWSSTAYSAVNARDLRFYSGYFGPQNYNDKGYGFAVRCVAQ